MAAPPAAPLITGPRAEPLEVGPGGVQLLRPVAQSFRSPTEAARGMRRGGGVALAVTCRPVNGQDNGQIVGPPAACNSQRPFSRGAPGTWSLL